MMNRPMELDIWKGDWGLPSVDLDCLQILAYTKFAGVPIQINKTNNPLFTPTGSLPVFRHNKHKYTTYSDVAKYLTQKNFSPDFGLNKKQLAEILAYTKFLKENLYPALQYIWWVDERNFIGLTRGWFARALPFPLNYYYPGRYKSNAEDVVMSLYQCVENLDVVQKEIYRRAEECLTAMATRLGELDFMFGPHPTSLDAVLYAYLAPLLKAPFPNAVLQNHLKSCSNLHKYIIRITQRYFPNEALEYDKKQKESMKDPTKGSNNEVEFPHRRRNQVLAPSFAILAMIGYAVSTEIVHVIEKKYLLRCSLTKPQKTNFTGLDHTKAIMRPKLLTKFIENQLHK